MRIRTVPDLDNIDGIPNPDLKMSGELSAMCSTEEAATAPGVSFAGAPPLPERPTRSSCTRPPETRLHTEVFGPEDNYPIAGLLAEKFAYCIT
jgi:hypothetical protein